MREFQFPKNVSALGRLVARLTWLERDVAMLNAKVFPTAEDSERPKTFASNYKDMSKSDRKDFDERAQKASTSQEDWTEFIRDNP